MSRCISFFVNAMRSCSAHILIALIYLYRLCVSPYTPSSCRFYPSCSQYALEAIQTHGAYIGSLLTLQRLAKCHPFSRAAGVDLVPCHSSCTRHHDSV